MKITINRKIPMIGRHKISIMIYMVNYNLVLNILNIPPQAEHRI